MRLRILLPFVIISGVSLAALQGTQTQEVRVTTADIQTVAGGRGGGGAGLVGGPPMAVGTGVVFGKIVEADSNTAVPGAIVTINLPGTQKRPTNAAAYTAGLASALPSRDES